MTFLNAIWDVLARGKASTPPFSCFRSFVKLELSVIKNSVSRRHQAPV